MCAIYVFITMPTQNQKIPHREKRKKLWGKGVKPFPGTNAQLFEPVEACIYKSCSSNLSGCSNGTKLIVFVAAEHTIVLMCA